MELHAFDEERDGPHCHRCGYPLCGHPSPTCSKCGQPRCRRLSYFERAEFDAMRAALDLGGVPYAYHDPHVGALGMHTLVHGFNFQPVLLIKWEDQRRAEQAIDAAGLSPPVALVEMSHPYCPCCGFALPPHDDGECRCSVCDALCAWYDPAQDDDGESLSTAEARADEPD